MGERTARGAVWQRRSHRSASSPLLRERLKLDTALSTLPCTRELCCETGLLPARSRELLRELLRDTERGRSRSPGFAREAPLPCGAVEARRGTPSSMKAS